MHTSQVHSKLAEVLTALGEVGAFADLAYLVGCSTRTLYRHAGPRKDGAQKKPDPDPEMVRAVFDLVEPFGLLEDCSPAAVHRAAKEIGRMAAARATSQPAGDSGKELAETLRATPEVGGRRKRTRDG